MIPRLYNKAGFYLLFTCLECFLASSCIMGERPTKSTGCFIGKYPRLISRILLNFSPFKYLSYTSDIFKISRSLSYLNYNQMYIPIIFTPLSFVFISIKKKWLVSNDTSYSQFSIYVRYSY